MAMLDGAAVDPFDAALAGLQQAAIDLNGDGRPDAVVVQRPQANLLPMPRGSEAAVDPSNRLLALGAVPSLSDSGPLPGQDWPQSYDPQGVSRFGEVALDFGKVALDAGHALAKTLGPPIPGWNIPTLEESEAARVAALPRHPDGTVDRRAAFEQGVQKFLTEGGKQVAYTALPVVGKVAPKIAAAIAGPLTQALPAQAGPAPSDDVRRLQTQLRDAGYYKGPIDGVMGEGTRSAHEASQRDLREKEQQAIERSRAEAEGARAKAESAKADAQIAETKRLENEATDLSARRQQGEERMREIEAEVPWYRQAVRDYGPPLGYAAGIGFGVLSRGKVNAASDRASAAASERADALMSGLRGADWPTRAARVNQFYSEGQRPLMRTPEVPFNPNPGAPIPFKSNPSAPSASELYNPSGTRNALIDLGVAGAYGTEVGVTEGLMLPAAQRELAEARTAYGSDPSETNIKRLQAAIDHVAIWEAAGNAGRAGGLTHLGLLAKMKRNPTRPDVSSAEAERMRIDQYLARGGGSRSPSPEGPSPQPQKSGPGSSSQATSETPTTRGATAGSSSPEATAPPTATKRSARETTSAAPSSERVDSTPRDPQYKGYTPTPWGQRENKSGRFGSPRGKPEAEPDPAADYFSKSQDKLLKGSSLNPLLDLYGMA